MNEICTMLKPEIIEPATETEVVDMMIEDAKFGGTPELRAVAGRLLEAGYTLRATAAKMKMRPSTLWRWLDDADLKESLEKGAAYRRKALSHRLQDAASDAVGALAEVVGDPGVAPRDRVKAAEAILDRCGIIDTANTQNDMAIAVDIDFDERLARIVAANRATTK